MEGIGTAFNIAPGGLWVTARHVMDDVENVCEINPGAEPYLMWVGSGAGKDVPDLEGGPVPIRCWHTDGVTGSDIAVIQTFAGFRGDEQITFPCLRLSSPMPKPGVKVAGVGYPVFEAEFGEETEESIKVDVLLDIKLTSGVIEEVLPEGRDSFVDLDGVQRGMLPNPCFRTDARFDGGMSGGPVINADGDVLGIIASGTGDNDGYISWASWAPYVYTFTVEDGDKRTLIYDLGSKGQILTDRHFKNLVVQQNEDGTISAKYPVV
jgi:hypothetical protein